mgnify:FL=1
MMNQYFFVRCRTCKISWDNTDSTTFRELIDSHRAANPGHKAETHFVMGWVSSTVKCRTSCVNATGGYCDCSCGGRDHGRYAGAC